MGDLAVAVLCSSDSESRCSRAENVGGQLFGADSIAPTAPLRLPLRLGFLVDFFDIF
jgi:hypothetical protein